MGCAGSKTEVKEEGKSPALVAVALEPAPQAKVGEAIDKAEEPTAEEPAVSSDDAPIPTCQAHQGVPEISSEDKKSKISRLVGTKYIMFSYQWDVQEDVKVAHDMLKAKGIPTWMDIDGGMQTDIYDSMAEGVGNAAVIVPFMSQKYESSVNCKLELKFGQQTGVPIVPVMMQPDYTPRGWLGLLTAGLLWTPMYDKESMEENVEGLMRQIELALDSETTDIQEISDAPDFSVNELRDELDRLKQDQNEHAVGLQTSKRNGVELALVPSPVPELPRGVLVTQGMERILSYLTASDKSRVGFLGMGGIGKTVVASWLVRHQSVREYFEHIVWVTLGQTPSALTVQSLALKQLTGTGFSGDVPPDERSLELQHAMKSKRLLLVIDDCWDPSHELLLNFVDAESGSKVLLSSRVRDVLDDHSAESSVIVDIELPNEEDAVRMLRSTAGLPDGGDLPAQARELVQFCKFLPLSISIAGKLVADLGIGLEAEDWEGIVEMMRDEFASEQRTVEESVIATSLNSIQGPHKEGIMHLFKSLALLPEDAVVPLAIVSMMCESVARADGSYMKRPNTITIRRWVKQLIDRSLVLGTVDRPRLHDIVGDFVCALHTEEELRQAHRQLVDLLRASRPVDATSKFKEWNNADNTPLSRYVRDYCTVHIENGWEADWESDEHAIQKWLCDYPADDIVTAAGLYLGFEKLSKLVSKVDVEQNSFEFAKLATAAGRCARARQSADMNAAVVLERKAMDALGALGDNRESEQRICEEHLELESLLRLIGDANPEDFKYLSRLDYLLTTPAAKATPVVVGWLKFYPAFLQMASGQTADYNEHGPKGRAVAEQWLPFPRAFAELARTHADEGTRLFAAMQLGTVLVYEITLIYRLWNWDEICGTNGELLLMSLRGYNYDVHHKGNMSVGAVGCDAVVVWGLSASWLAVHYGDMVAANAWVFDRVPQLWDRILAEPNRTAESGNKVFLPMAWAPYAAMVGQQDKFLPIFTKAGINWATADAFIDKESQSINWFRPRNDTTVGQHMTTTEAMAWHTKFAWLLIARDPGVTADEVAAALPSIEEIIVYAKGGFPHSHFHAHGTDCFNLFLGAAQACETLGLHEQALAYAEEAITNTDIMNGGTAIPTTRCQAFRVKGRCLALLGQSQAAEEALESALSTIEGLELFLFEVLAWRDLKVCVLDQDGRGKEGSASLKASIHQLLGTTPIADQVEALAPALGHEVDLLAVLKGE